MLINEVPMVIRDKHWYAVPSAVGCVLTVLVCKGVDAGIVSFPAEVVLDLLIVALMVSMRLVSVISTFSFRERWCVIIHICQVKRNI